MKLINCFLVKKSLECKEARFFPKIFFKKNRNFFQKSEPEHRPEGEPVLVLPGGRAHHAGLPLHGEASARHRQRERRSAGGVQ